MTQPHDPHSWRQYNERGADAYPAGQDRQGAQQWEGDGQWRGGYQRQTDGQLYGSPRRHQDQDQGQWFGDHQPYSAGHRQADGQWQPDDPWRGGDQWRGDGQWRGADQWRGDGQWQPEAPVAAQTRRPDASRWNWLLLVPIVVPLLTTVYNRMEPRLFGLPFFYWCQLAFAFLATVVMVTVYLATKGRGNG